MVTTTLLALGRPLAPSSLVMAHPSQSDKATIVAVFAKGCKPEGIKCSFEPRSLKAEITLPSGQVHR
jgi:hypothetical protein